MATVRLDITNRSSFANAQAFGDIGPYQLLEGTAHFAVDPLSPRNTAIVDIELAHRDSSGKVWFSSDFGMLQPADPDRSNHRILFDVVNRGRKTALSLNGVPSLDPTYFHQ